MKAIVADRRFWIAVLLLASMGGIGWWQRQSIQAWYQVRQLANAQEDEREQYAAKVIALDEAAVPSLLGGLRSEDAIVCGNMQYAFSLLTSQWGGADLRTHRLVDGLHAQFATFSAPGQDRVLQLLTTLLQRDVPRPLPTAFARSVGKTLTSAEKKPELRPAALRLAAEWIDSVQPGQWADVCRDMAERGLKDERPAARIAALQLLQRDVMRKDRELLERSIPLLRDTDTSVRRAALIALAPEIELVREDHFLPLLHDSDLQVQYLSELALRKRGLNDDNLAMARLISDKDPKMRLRVLNYFDRVQDLNLKEWLRQLSNDPAPAVRAAAIRAAVYYPHVDLTQRLLEMAESDPSASVRENARYYLSLRREYAARY